MLPDVNEVYPQDGVKPVQRCTESSCGAGLYVGDEIIEYAGYHFCSFDCVVDDMLSHGHMTKITIGG